MISNEQKSLGEKGYFTIAELAKISGVSRRTIQRACDKGILKPSLVGNNDRRYFSANDLIWFSTIQRAQMLGVSQEDFEAVMNGMSMQEVISRNFGELLYWLKVLEADTKPFSYFSTGNIVQLDFLRTKCYRYQFKKTAGWDAVIKMVHDGFVSAIRAGYTPLNFGMAAKVSFSGNGIPETDTVVIAVKDQDGEDLVELGGNSYFYAAWYGPTDIETAKNVKNEFDVLSGCSLCSKTERGPVSIKDAFDAEAEYRGYTTDGDYYLFFAEDFYSKTENNPALFSTYMSVGIK